MPISPRTITNNAGGVAGYDGVAGTSFVTTLRPPPSRFHNSDVAQDDAAASDGRSTFNNGLLTTQSFSV